MDDARWSPEQFRQYQEQQAKKKGNKFGAKRAVVDGKKFDSTKEANYYGTLKLRMKCGEITKIDTHKVYKLDVNGVHICDYEADFVITLPDGTVQVIDVKGAATENLPVFRMKKALMYAIHDILVIIA